MSIRPLLVSLVLTMALASFFSSDASGVTCESCHSSSGPNSGYAFEEPVITIVHDPFYRPGDEFQISLVLVPMEGYELRSLSGTIKVDGNASSLVSEENQEGSVDEEGRAIAYWSLRGEKEGTAVIEIEHDFKVYYDHSSGGNKDIGTYSGKVSAEILIGDMSLLISPGTVLFTEIGQEISLNLAAEGNVSGIEIELPGELRGAVEISDFRTELNEGEEETVLLKLVNMTELTSSITIRWVEEGELKELPVEVRIADLKIAGGGRDFYLTIGQITGISSFIFLVVGYFTGGSHFMKRYANRLFKHAARRVKFHCNLSKLVMILAFFHLAVLWYGPYRESIWDWEVVLGWLAVVIMLVISVNGALQKQSIKLIGYENWRRIHAWGTYLVTGLVAVHLLMYGSHFQWFRDLVMGG
ncbi:MAG: hypothetical protein ACMUIE_10665 [Thermoplasmatota archaeon]